MQEGEARWRSSALGYLLVLMVAADLAFVVGHVVTERSTLIPTGMFRLDRDHGYPEFFQYLKFYWIIITLAVLLRKTRSAVYAAWIVVFGYMLLDDALRIHELGGSALAESWAIGGVIGLRADDIGELFVTASAGLLLLALLGVGYWRSGPAARAASVDFLSLIALLVFFGIALDMLHQIAGYNWVGDIVLVAEDGGEMIVVSLILAYACALMLRGGRVDSPLWKRAPLPARWRRAGV